jgi:Tfp pilus assembly protein PilP
MSPFLKKSFATLTVVSALASVVATGREQPSSIVEPAAPRVDTRPVQNADIDLAKLDERIDEGAKVDAFAPRNFSPVVPPQAAAKARPEAPPLPFKYLGKMVEDGKLSVFLTNGDESITVHAGERVGDYRVDKITEAEVRFTYLPLKTKQSLPL